VERRTISGHLKGKLGYMSPEQVMGLELDARSDLFTLGIVFAELLTLRPLFMGPSEIDTLTRIRDADVRSLKEDPSIPPDVLMVLLRALAQLPDVRYEGARAFANDIEELARHRGMSLGAPRLAAWMENLGGYSWHPPTAHDAPTPVVAPARLGLPATSDLVVRPGEAGPPSSVYRVELTDGSVLGPMSYARLAELFATGGAAISCRVSRDDGPFGPAGALPELQRFVTGSTLMWEGDESWSQRARVALDRMCLPGWLFRLAAERRTGAILLRDGLRRKKVYLVDGAPEFAASTDKRELLGEHLIKERGLLRVEVELARSMLPRYGGRLGDALVGLGVLRPVELVRAIHEQTIERYLELFRWAHGEFAFDPGASSGEEAFPLGTAPFDLVGRGVRESYSHEEISGWLAALGGAIAAPAHNPLLRRDVLRWTPGEERALAALDAPVPTDAFLAREGARPDVGPRDAARALFLGVSFGVLEIDGFRSLDLPA
jgi:serine/threonine-protein kinase